MSTRCNCLSADTLVRGHAPDHPCRAWSSKKLTPATYGIKVSSVFHEISAKHSELTLRPRSSLYTIEWYHEPSQEADISILV